MTQDLYLRRKLRLRAHGQQVIFIKRSIESSEHVLMKAFLWALYLPTYPALQIEIKIGDRYKPDVVQLDAQRAQPQFWGEAGVVSQRKLQNLLRRFRDTHFAFAKWNSSLAPLAETVGAQLAATSRTAAVDLLSFPADAAERFIAGNEITIGHDDIEWLRL